MYSDLDRENGYGTPAYTQGRGPVTGAQPLTKKATTFVNWAGAVTSVALILGVGVWGYKLAVRDVSGVPVVAAIDGPMRVQPDNPGGRPAQHQGLAVNEVAALGTAPPPPDQLTLAPAPIAIEADDAVGVALPVSAEAPASETQLDLSNVQDVAASTTPPNAPATQAALEELVAAIGASTPALSAVTPAVVSGGLGTSLRPKGRPAGGPSVVVASAPAGDVSSVTLGAEIDPSAIPAGTRLVQLGAFDSAEVARAEWKALSKQFDGYLASKKRVVQRAESGGKVFYRLRAVGFEDLADARRFCTALVAENAACIPVVTR